ncbi:hypothetical protein AAY473_001583 [Plecturocebus cupreus]
MEVWGQEIDFMVDTSAEHSSNWTIIKNICNYSWSHWCGRKKDLSVSQGGVSSGHEKSAMNFYTSCIALSHYQGETCSKNCRCSFKPEENMTLDFIQPKAMVLALTGYVEAHRLTSESRYFSTMPITLEYSASTNAEANRKISYCRSI